MWRERFHTHCGKWPIWQPSVLKFAHLLTFEAVQLGKVWSYWLMSEIAGAIYQLEMRLVVNGQGNHQGVPFQMQGFDPPGGRRFHYK